jgi:hypothetical protein
MVIRKGNIVPSWGLELGKIAVENTISFPKPAILGKEREALG